MAKFKVPHGAYRSGLRYAGAGGVLNLKPGQRPGHFWIPLDSEALAMLKALPPYGEAAAKRAEKHGKADARAVARLDVKRGRFERHLAKHEAHLARVVEARKKGEEPPAAPPEEEEAPKGAERGEGGLAADPALSAPRLPKGKKRAADEDLE